jgi:hypothetical protein
MSLDEKLKKVKWEKRSSNDKHMILMYLYRLETDLPYIELYIETYRCREMRFNKDELPTIIKNMDPEKLRAAAYAAIGAKLP